MIFESYIVSLAAGLSLEAAKAAFSYIESKRPDIVARAKAAQLSKNSTEIERVFQEAVGVIDAAAATGEIHVESGTLSALKGVRFDHQHGRVSIVGTTISAPILMTGGGVGSTGKTVVGENTSLKSKGTEIRLGKGASITMTGNAKIEQT